MVQNNPELRCCLNCDCCVFIHEYEVFWCMEKNETVKPMDVCDDWDRWIEHENE